MMRSRFTEEQITYALRQADSRAPAADVCRQLGVSEATFYVWKQRYANLDDDVTTATPVFITTTTLSPVARDAADWLKIKVRESHPLSKSYPMIKCNINSATGERIYHLPFDQQHDRTNIIPSTGDFYAETTAEAEAKGFRRAHRYRGDRSTAAAGP